MSRLTIYGDSISGNCLKVRWTAERLGIPFDWREVSVVAGQTRTPEMMAINPWGQVPFVRLADGRMLTQSNAIIAHLAEGSHLIPADAYDRAQMWSWLFWEQYSHEPAIAVRRFHVQFRKTPEADIPPHLLSEGHAALAHMEGALTKRPYLVGDHLSLADIALVAYTRWADEGGYELSSYPALLAWISRVEEQLHLPHAPRRAHDGAG
jgi:glutathione S-transferase